MLDQLIENIRGGSSSSVSALAARLNVSPEMVIAMLEYLEKSGYVRQIGACLQPCKGCPLSEGCVHFEGLTDKVWAWVDK